VQIDLSALVGIIALAAAAPIVADLVPRMSPPLVVVEIVLGIVFGPPALHLIHVTPLADLLSQFGLAFLFFLAGFELEPERVRGMPAPGREHVARLACARLRHRRGARGGGRRRRLPVRGLRSPRRDWARSRRSCATRASSTTSSVRS